MRNSIERWNAGYVSLALLVVLCGFTAALSSSSRPQATITINNNSSRQIVHLYTSPVDRKEWSEDRLPEGSKLQTGDSFTLNSVIAESDQINVIAEDKDGCFSNATVSCQDPSAWTITNTTQGLW